MAPPGLSPDRIVRHPLVARMDRARRAPARVRRAPREQWMNAAILCYECAMTEWLEHGTPEDRLSACRPDLAFAAGGRVLLAMSGGSIYYGVKEARCFDCVEVETGRVHRAGLVDAMAAHDEHAFIAPAGTGTVRALRLPDLEVEATYEVGTVEALDGDARTIVAAIQKAPLVALIDRERATVRSVTLSDAA